MGASVADLSLLGLSLPVSVERPVLVSLDNENWHVARGEEFCAAAKTESGLERKDGELCCSHTGCPFHQDFCARSNQATETEFSVIHCGGTERTDLVTEVVRTHLVAEDDRKLLLAEIERSYEEINWLHGLTERIRGDADSFASLDEIILYARHVFPIRAASVWSPEGEDTLRCAFRWCQDESERTAENLALPRTLDSLFETGSTLILRDELPNVDEAIREVLEQTTNDLGGLPVVCLRLGTATSFLGILLLRLEENNRHLTTPEINRLALTARQMSLSLQISSLLEELRKNEGLKKEVEIARKIQHGLLPQETPQGPGFDLFAGCVTAARVGGDYYDFFPHDDKLGLLIADVSGHSVASGLIGVSFRSSIRQFLGSGTKIDTLLSAVNASLYNELHVSGHFLSAFYADFDHETLTLKYVNAGHNHPFVYRSETEEFFDLTESSLLIGILPETSHPVGEFALQAGDVLIMYTDGIVEAENQQLEAFGDDRLKQFCKKYSKRSAKQVYHQLLKEMYVFQDELFNKDDVTLVVFKVRESSTEGQS